MWSQAAVRRAWPKKGRGLRDEHDAETPPHDEAVPRRAACGIARLAWWLGRLRGVGTQQYVSEAGEGIRALRVWRDTA